MMPRLTSLTLCRLFYVVHTTRTPALSTLSLHDALPIYAALKLGHLLDRRAVELDDHIPLAQAGGLRRPALHDLGEDRKSTRLNSSHTVISYAVFCLKKKTHAAHVRLPLRHLRLQGPLPY